VPIEYRRPARGEVLQAGAVGCAAMAAPLPAQLAAALLGLGSLVLRCVRYVRHS